MAAKIVLSRLGVPQSSFRRLGLFRHGPMGDPAYVRGVFNSHVTRAGLDGLLQGKTVLEIGPGEGVGTALLAYAYGAQAILMDDGRHAGADLAPYRALAESLAREGLGVPQLDGQAGLDGLLRVCNARYLTQGLESWADLADNSVDLIFSQAVLEHVRLADFDRLLGECRRVLRPGGACSHRIDLSDHLGGGLNNLRFSHDGWESDFLARSGFYTNRIRYHDMLQRFERAGFEVQVLAAERWETLPIPKRRMAPEFQTMQDSDLLVSGFNVILRSG